MKYWAIHRMIDKFVYDKNLYNNLLLIQQGRCKEISNKDKDYLIENKFAFKKATRYTLNEMEEREYIYSKDDPLSLTYKAPHYLEKFKEVHQ